VTVANNNELTLLLPKLKTDSDVKASDASGVWDPQPPKAFSDVASSLDYQAPGQTKSISSVPTVWARPLSFEMALHNKYYPVRDAAIAQWQGMLAAIALAEVRGYYLTLKADILRLDTLRDRDPFARALYELLPDAVNSLYSLPNDRHPWTDVYVFTWNDRPVGMTSPSTLVVPSEEGNWDGLPWWSGENGQLQAPHRFINDTEKGLLYRWLENLRSELGNHGGSGKATNQIGELVDEFKNSLLSAAPNEQLLLSNDPQFFGVELNVGALVALNKPVKAKPKASNILIVPSKEKKDKPGLKPLAIVDPNIAEAWNESPQNIWVWEDRTLAAVKLEDVPELRTRYPDVEFITTDELFLPDFWFVDRDEILPGGFFPTGNQPIVFQGERVTPLIPLNPILLNYLTPEALVKAMQLQPVNDSRGVQIRVIIDLPLVGLDADGKTDSEPKNYRIFKDYPIEETRALKEVPVLEVWPQFRAENWQEYYGFYYDAEYGEDTFQVSFPNAQTPHIFKENRGTYQLVGLEEYPAYIECKNGARNLGLILLETPPEVTLADSWTVGVDFGTSFSNVYINRKDIPESLPLENLHLQVTETPIDTRLNVLFEYFIPENFIPSTKPLPLSTVLTTRGQPTDRQADDRPIFDGRIYVPDLFRFKPQEAYIKTDLKWSTEGFAYAKLFLNHLALHVSALAAKNGANQIQWSLSFPSAFSRRDKNRYAKVWEDIVGDLNKTTGIKHFCPDPDDTDYFRTESLAIAQYFKDQEDLDLVNTTCIDMGGGTSDISIWEGNQLVHQCSVQLAGRDLFSQFLQLNPKFLERRFDVDGAELRGLRGPAFNSKIDVLLRLKGEDWLNKRAAISDESDFRGLVRLTAIGYAGLYYYVGILLRVLHERGRYETEGITPVYMGGNGSRLLNWLAEGGRFDKNAEFQELLSRMLSKGTALYDEDDLEGLCFEDTEEVTRLSEKPKDEAACGLVIKYTDIETQKRKKQEPVIAGEDCELDGEVISWDADLEFEDDVKRFKVPKLERLSRFLYDFHEALRDLDIEGIDRLPDYTRSRKMEDNDKLWRLVQKELNNLLLDIKGDAKNIRVEPTFILGLKALLIVLGKEWAGK